MSSAGRYAVVWDMMKEKCCEVQLALDCRDERERDKIREKIATEVIWPLA